MASLSLFDSQCFRTRVGQMADHPGLAAALIPAATLVPAAPVPAAPVPATPVPATQSCRRPRYRRLPMVAEGDVAGASLMRGCPPGARIASRKARSYGGCTTRLPPT
ncbi:MAG: hypothetical protein Kow00122_02100 [Thermoleophilia bacterium]